MKKLLVILLAIVPVFVMGQSKKESATPHYLFPAFENTIVRMKGGKLTEANMNYNLVTQEMVYNQGGKMLAVTRIETIDTVYLNQCKFVPYGQKFYEQVFKGPISFFIEHKRNASAGGQPSGYGGTTQTSAITSVSSWSGSGGVYELNMPADIIITDATIFWVRVNHNMQSFLNERQLLKIFPDKKNEIKDLISKNKINITSKEGLAALGALLNK